MTPTTPAEFVAWLRERADDHAADGKAAWQESDFHGKQASEDLARAFRFIAGKAEAWLVTDQTQHCPICEGNGRVDRDAARWRCLLSLDTTAAVQFILNADETTNRNEAIDALIDDAKEKQNDNPTTEK